MHAIVKTHRAPGAEIATVDAPQIGRSEVLVKTEAAAICGTDMHIWEWNAWAQDRIKRIPLIFGH
jgi:threonine 3-dehydrogenase